MRAGNVHTATRHCQLCHRLHRAQGTVCRGSIHQVPTCCCAPLASLCHVHGCHRAGDGVGGWGEPWSPQCIEPTLFPPPFFGVAQAELTTLISNNPHGKSSLGQFYSLFARESPVPAEKPIHNPACGGGVKKKTEVGTHACRFPPPPSPPGLPAGNQETGWRPRAGAGGGEGLTGVGASRAERCEFRPLPPAPLPPSL